jgi:hypothetical protein
LSYARNFSGYASNLGTFEPKLKVMHQTTVLLHLKSKLCTKAVLESFPIGLLVSFLFLNKKAPAQRLALP